MLDRSKLHQSGEKKNGKNGPRDEFAPLPVERSLAQGLPNWDLEPPSSILRRRGASRS